MARVCQITGKKGLSGHRVSHANNKSNHVQRPNLQKKRIFVPELNRYVSLTLSAKGLILTDCEGQQFTAFYPGPDSREHLAADLVGLLSQQQPRS